jgi:hypothetical protein
MVSKKKEIEKDIFKMPPNKILDIIDENKCNQENTKIKSTPRSCIQKKSSVYKSSKSSSFLTIGTIIGSGIKLNESIVPLNKLAKMVRNVKKPKSEFISWNDTESVAKYFNKLPILMFM